jgi:tRNA 2-thiouridine synthesizing protein C
MTQTVNIIITKSTFAGADFKESLDLALVCAAFEHLVNLIFTDDGVYNLLDNQQHQLLAEKDQTALLKGLNFYDIENIYVDADSLKARSITTDNLMITTGLLEPKDLNQLNLQADQVVVI